MNSELSNHLTNSKFYDRISHAYDALADSNEHRARESGESLLAAKPGERVLEIGFGTGQSMLALAGAVGEQGQACGLDVSEGMLTVAQRKVDDAGFSDRVDLRVGDAVSLPWPEESFDGVFFSFTLELFSEDDIISVLAEVRRVLRSSGRVVVVGMATVRPNEKDSYLEKTYQWMHRHFPHIVDCRPIDAVDLLSENGFIVAEENRTEIWTMPVAAVLATKSA